jgi:hypothetical protein
MTARRFDVASAGDAALTPGGPGLYADGWAARTIPTAPAPTHVTDCLMATYGFPPEVCACTAGTEWLRERRDHQRLTAA